MKGNMKQEWVSPMKGFSGLTTVLIWPWDPIELTRTVVLELPSSTHFFRQEHQAFKLKSTNMLYNYIHADLVWVYRNSSSYLSHFDTFQPMSRKQTCLGNSYAIQTNLECKPHCKLYCNTVRWFQHAISLNVLQGLWWFEMIELL